MALETLSAAKIGDQLLVFSETETHMYLVQGRSESLSEPTIKFRVLDLNNNESSELLVELDDLDDNILGVFLSKRA